MRVRGGKKIWLVALMVFVAVFLFTFLTAKFKNNIDVEAANLANFDPGYIISDYQMGNYNSMSEAEIWNFLKQKGNCNDTRIWQTGNNLGYLSESAPYSWHVSDGHYVCLADENFSGESAAHIIWQAAQDYRINPQVLIVLLQKEQGLITDSFPNSVQYRSATGYGCPDTAACSSRYYGFKNQVRNAAALFRTVLDGGWTNYPLGNNYIQYNPNSGCGGSWVNIRSLATSALYRYTPYQPNASALAAGYGAGDSCGSYGNRNFYSYFEDWFGGVTATKSADDILNDRIRETFDLSSDYSGVFNIVYSGNNNAVIGIHDDNTEVSIYDGVGVYQQWKIEKIEDYYVIKNNTTGKVLDVSGGVFSNKTNVWQYELNKTCAQRWNFVKNSDSTITIHNACYPQYVLDLQNGDTNVQIYKKTDYENNHQKWVLQEIDVEDYSGRYSLIYFGNRNKSMIVGGDNIEVGDLAFENKLQQWRIEKIENYHIISNIQTGKVLDVSGGVFSNKTNVWQYELNKTCAQRWNFVKNSDSTITIHNACYPQYVLDLQNGDTNVQIYKKTDYENNHQKWVLQEI